MKSKYFKRKEFACKCGCGFQAVDVELLDILELVREFFNEPVIINSACRCEKHNAEVGGTKDSQHVKGMACDIVVKNISAEKVHKALETLFPDSLGLGKYNNFTHIDVREGKARWQADS